MIQERFPLDGTVKVRDAWGMDFGSGVVVGYIGPHSLQVKFSNLQKPAAVPVSLVEDAVSQDLQNLQHFLDTANAERDALAIVVGTQCELISTLQAQAAAHKAADASETPWFEKLLDLLELYMSRQTGSRRPLTIADADLRALYFHIIN